MDPRLTQLMQAAEMVQDRETVRLVGLRGRIAALQAAYRAVGLPPAGDMLACGFAQSGGLQRMQRHADRQRADINRELAQLRAQLPAQEQATRRALGRCIALERLRARMVLAKTRSRP